MVKSKKPSENGRKLEFGVLYARDAALKPIVNNAIKLWGGGDCGQELFTSFFFAPPFPKSYHLSRLFSYEVFMLSRNHCRPGLTAESRLGIDLRGSVPFLAVDDKLGGWDS